MIDVLAAADEAVAAPLAACLALDDIFALALSAGSCQRLCRSAVRAVHLQAFDGDSAQALLRLVRSSLTDRGLTIRELNASFCCDVSSASLKSLPKLQALESINLNGCQNIDDEGLLALAQRCSKLRSISLYWNVKVTDKGLCKLLRAQQGQELRHLNFSGCKHLSDETVQRIVSKAPNAEHLDLTRCNQVTDVGALLVCECLASLRVLRLYAMAQLNPQAFTALHKLLWLEELDLCGCRVEDGAIVRWLDSCAPSKVEILNLTWCPALTDTTVLAIAQSCPNLAWLSVFGNLNITSYAIERLAAAPCGEGGKLHSLDVRGLTKAQEYALDSDRLRTLFPALVCWDLHH